MKNLLKHSLLYLTIAATIFNYSCSEDEEPELPTAPSITVSFKVNDATATTATAGDELTYTLNLTAEGQINTLWTKVFDGTATQTGSQSRTELGLTDLTSATLTIDPAITITEAQIGKTYTYTFILVDDADQTDTASFEIEIVEPASPDARAYSAVLISAPTEDKTNKNFFSSSDGMTYSGDDVTSTTEAISPKIDFGYYYGSTDHASIASPAAFAGLSVAVFAAQVANWGTKNETVIKATTLTAAQFTEVVTFADIDEVFEGGTDEEGIITGLEAGNVVAFETAAGKRGLILVTEVSGTFNEDDYIEIDVLVQEEE